MQEAGIRKQQWARFQVSGIEKAGHRDLLVWQKSMDLAVRCYTMARQFPKQDQMVLGYQIRKSSVSMPSNIAEGHSRRSTPHYVQHLWTAHASGAELETQLEIGTKVEIIPLDQ